MVDTIEENEEPLLYPDCPGCKQVHLVAEGTAVPIMQLLMLASVAVCDALNTSTLFPYLYIMVDDFHVAKATEDIGYYAGAISSVCMVGGFFTAVLWGKFADKYGRRPVLFLGLLSIVVFQLLFGVSTNYWVGLFARFCLGAFNGIPGPIKAYASEICSAENQAWGMSFISTSWTVGYIVGPAIGGYLARPALNFPGLFSADSLFGQFPYFLPCLCQAIFAALNIFLVLRLPETIHTHNKAQQDVEQPSDGAAKSSLSRNWPLMASIAVSCSFALYDMSFREVFSLWCVSPEENNGLGMQSSDLGTVLTISGFGMFLIQLTLYPPLAKNLGPTLVTRTSAILIIPLVVIFPFLTAFDGGTRWLILCLLLTLRDMLSAMVTTGTYLMVNNAVQTYERGEANGLSVAYVSVSRAIGPVIAGAFYAWSLSRRNATFLPGSQMVFFILDALCIVALFTMFPPFLPEAVDHPYEPLQEQ